tara:strand:+ start:320 stop:571 length:252 start_codon:yes stop_codon:yes gene_type:complete
MSNRKHKSDLPEEVINHCIDNKLTVAEGLIGLIEEKFEAVDRCLKSLKNDVTSTLNKGSDLTVTNSDMQDVEDFLKGFDNTNL